MLEGVGVAKWNFSLRRGAIGQFGQDRGHHWVTVIATSSFPVASLTI